MAPLASYFVLALGALAAAAPIVAPGSLEQSEGLGKALEKPAAAGRDPNLEPAAPPPAQRDPALEPAAQRDPALEPAAPPADGRDPALEPAAERDPALEPAAPPAAPPADDRGRAEAERGAGRGAGRGRPEDERGAGRGRPEDERGAGRGRGQKAAGGRGGQNRAEVCVAALEQIKVNLAETGPQLQTLNEEFGATDAALAELFGVMRAGLRDTQAACLKIGELVLAGGAAPEAERQIIIKGLGGARDALNRLDSGDQAVKARLRQAKASLRQTITTGNRILTNCVDNGAVTSVAVPSAEETGAASSVAVPSAEESGVASISATESGVAVPTARPTASDDVVTSTAAPVESSAAAPEASAAPPQVLIPGAPEACPPAATVTVTAAAPTVTVTVTAGGAGEAVSSAAAVSSGSVAAPEASGEASGVVSADAVIATLRPVGSVARR